VFRHSIGLGYAQRDITLDLRGLLEAPIVTHHASITDPREVGVQHIVPLSHQALAILRELETLTGNGRYLFPALGDPDRTMSENTINHALRTLGFEGDEMTGHGFRSIASTLLNEQGCWTADAIERQLSHGERDSVRAAYNYAEYLPERQQMMQAWADYLDDLREGRKTARQQKALSTALPNRETSEQRVA
jgi:integrase